MTHDEHRARQESILRQVLAILRGDERVLGVVAGGSYARGEHNAFSDLDLACYLRDEARSGREELYECVGRAAPLLCRLWIYDVNALYLFANGVRLDLDFHPPSRLGEWQLARADTAILHDPDGALAAGLPRRDAPGPAPHPAWFDAGDPDFVDWFFWMFRQVICWARRGGGGYHTFEKLTAAVDSLAQVRTRLAEMRLWTLDGGLYLSEVDAECAGHLAAAYPRLDAEEIIACLMRLFAEYRRIAPDYCRKAGIPFPVEKVAAMDRLLAEFAGLY